VKPENNSCCGRHQQGPFQFVRIFLENASYRVVACNSGDQALEAFRRAAWTLVLTDLMMPGVDGSRLIEEVKRVSPQTPPC